MRGPLTRSRVLSLAALTAVTSFALVADSFAQRLMMRGPGVMHGPSTHMVPSRIPHNVGRVPGHVGRFPGGIGRIPDRHFPSTGPRFPGRPRFPGGPAIVIAVPPTGLPGRAPAVVMDDDDGPPSRRPPKKTRRASPPPNRPGFIVPPPGERRLVANEVLVTTSESVPQTALNAILRRHRLTRLETQDFALTGRRVHRVRINGNRSVTSVINALRREAQLDRAGANYQYALLQAATGAAPAAGDATADQYALAKLRLAEAHALARGRDVLVAVIDSMVDREHPDLRGVIADTFNATGADDKPHPHGTGMAGAIASQGYLTGTAPAVRVLAVKAFGVAGKGGEGTTFHILKGIDWAAKSGARVINMSFAGPADPELHDMLAAARRKGVVLVAAAGNAGPKSPPLYPAADSNVIAVTATDAQDRAFERAVRGAHIAVAAPGVDILVPAPDASYQLTSGTSVAAAEVSGVAALLVERDPKLGTDEVRRVLTSTAKDLGPKGHDPQFGAGLADAYQAVTTIAPPVTAKQ